MTPLEPIAWIALVARWTEIARASRAIPSTDTRLRDSVAHLIAIEATTAALGELARVPEAERPHARTIAELSIRSAATELDRLWRGEEWPSEFLDACETAERALRLAVYAGLESLIVGGDAAFEVPEFNLGIDASDPATLRGTLAAMPPGTIAMPGEPICWWCGREAPVIRREDAANVNRNHATLIHRRNLPPLQVYRSLDERGRFVDDTVAPITDELLPGLPLLVPIVLDGVPIGRFLHETDRWLTMQRAALNGQHLIPVKGAVETS